MNPTWRWRLMWAVLIVALSAPVYGQSFGFPWWRDARFQRELSLTVDQSSRIDAVFQQTIPKLRQKKQELDLLEDELSRLISTNADEQVVIKQVDKVEALRAHMNKTRTLMLLHMRQVLTPEQRLKLMKLHEQWEKDHPRGRSDR
jgi:Spy/CpxP family protein refolding chaperone